MADKDDVKDEIAVTEGKDGSATVDLPDSLMADDENGGDPVVTEAAEGGVIASDEDTDHPDDDAPLREAKRNRRRAKKDLIRKTNQEKDLRLVQLQRENEEIRNRLGQMERNTKSEHVVRLDKKLEDAQVRLEYAKMKLSEATQNNDGEAMVQAQTLWQSANDEMRSVGYQKQQATQELNRPQVNMPDPDVQRLAAGWMNKNKWYNPATTDRDSQVAKKIDELMVTQGWNPSDPDYWDELDERLQKELPHRYNGGNNEEHPNVRRPRNVVGSSGREASGAYGGSNRTQFVLSPERVKAMREAGAWDNPERKAKMIKQFISYDRANGRNN